MRVTERKTCRASGGKLTDVMDFGKLPFSSFLKPEDPDPVLYPVRLAFNEESSLLQLRDTVDPDEMYRHYWYLSGVNFSMRRALRSIVESALARSRGLAAGDIILDIASNDGTLLNAYPPGYYRVGIDPAQNIAPKGADLHINTYFSKEAYFAHVERKAKIVTSIAMFYDLEDPVQFSRDVAAVLEPEGLWIIELSYLPTMLELNAFDTICAEHLEYYSLRSIEYILHKARLRVEEVEKNGVNGGSFRLYVRHEEYVKEYPSVEAMRQEELVLDLSNLKIYREFQERIERNKEQMLGFLQEQRRLGKKVVGYGASTKGNTLLAYYGIGRELLSCVADRNPMKWGLETVTRIPILSEKEARALEPDFFLAFPYHFMEEFLERESSFLARGGKFLSPVPQLVLI